MIEQRLVNVTDLAIYRPNRTGPAGDTSPAGDVLIASGLRCIHQRTHRVRKAKNGTDVVVEALYFLDPFKPDGTPLDVRERDLLQHTDHGSGRLLQKRAVLAVSFEDLGDLGIDHVELEA